MSGWKTILAGIAGILTGLTMVATAIADGNYTGMVDGALAVVAALAVLGLGHKLDKVADVIRKFR